MLRCILEDSPDVEFITENNKDLKQRLQDCPKEKNHKYYISIDKFQRNPWQYIDKTFKDIEQLPEFVNCMSTLTGNIMVTQDGGETNGSGFIHKIRRVTQKDCPCHECLRNPVNKKKTFAILTVTTVLHVFVKECDKAMETGFFSENWEAANTKVRLFYDKENDESDGTETLIYGYKLLETDKEINIHSDWCSLECVTHDMELVQKLENQLNNYMELQGKIYKKSRELTVKNLVIIVGHPHGGPKVISVGKHTKIEILKEVRSYQQWCRYEYDNITCCGNSGSPIFILGQPLCGFGYWFGHPHNHSKYFKVEDKETNVGCSSVGVEQVDETN